MDLRLPIGMLFSLFGVILTIYGLVGPKEIYAKSLGINVNLVWGIVMLVFGAIFVLLSLRAAQRHDDTAEVVPGDVPGIIHSPTVPQSPGDGRGSR